MLAGALLLLAVTGAAPAASQLPPQRPACDSLDACLSELVARPTSTGSASEPHVRLSQYGAPAVDRLVPLLTHQDKRVRDIAGLALAQFDSIDPRHLPALLSAEAGGNDWMPRAITATGTDAALEHLWASFEAEPSSEQRVRALGRFGDRLKDRLLARIERCIPSSERGPCQGIFPLLGAIQPANPAWSLEPIGRLATSGRDEPTRHLAQDVLVQLRQPLGLELHLKQLQAMAEGPPRPRWQLARLIRGIAGYGHAAAEAGPLLIRLVGPEQEAETRVAAALAVGQIGATDAVAPLMALSGEFEGDWLLAYNAVESLGRLKASEARGLLSAVARHHWHVAVRNNAARALNHLAGGRFERPGIAGDVAPYRWDGASPMPMAIRYRGDVAPPRWPGSISGTQVQASPLDDLPAVREGALAITFPSPRDRPPPEAIAPPAEGGGMLSLVTRWKDGWLIGTNQGEWGGSLYRASASGRRKLFAANVISGFRWGGRHYFVSGLSHLGSSWGDLWEVDLEAERVIRRIRLLAEPTQLVVSDKGAVILRTRAGDMAIDRAGRLVAPERQ